MWESSAWCAYYIYELNQFSHRAKMAVQLHPLTYFFSRSLFFFFYSQLFFQYEFSSAYKNLHCIRFPHIIFINFSFDSIISTEYNSSLNSREISLCMDIGQIHICYVASSGRTCSLTPRANFCPPPRLTLY